MQNTGEKGSEYAHVYDVISGIYETACPTHYSHVEEVVKKVSKSLSPRSKILDMGCGTGKPIASHFASEGHLVTGVDFSQRMVDTARSQVPKAEFIKADITTYKPPMAGDYDVVITSHSLYNFSLGVIRTLILRFSLWVKKGGIVLVIFEEASPGTIGWARGLSGTFLDFHFDNMTYGSAKAWLELLQEIGLDIIDVDKRFCAPEDDYNKSNVSFTPSFGITAKRIVDNPLLGPYPVPKKLPEPFRVTNTNKQTWLELVKRMTWTHIQDEIVAKENTPRILVRSPSSLVSDLTGSVPVSNQNENIFDLVFNFEILHLVHSLEIFIKDTLHLLSFSGAATVAFVQAAPDNELVNLANEVIRDIRPTSVRHDGTLLQLAENILASAGFQITYEAVDVLLSFDDVEKDKRKGIVANLLADIIFSEDQSEDRIKFEHAVMEPLSQHFRDRPGQFAYRSVLLVARRPLDL